jgi:hypothetical protein
MFGARAQYNITNTALMQYRQRMWFGYVQDDWKVNRKLTINAGLRYEFSTPQYEDQNRIANYDPGTNKLYAATDKGLYGRSTVHPDYNNFAPRVGLAWSVMRKTVIRSAYGISYIHFNRAGGENVLAYNGPNIVTVQINQKPSQGVCRTGQDPTTCFLLTQQGYPPNLASPANFNLRLSPVGRVLSTGVAKPILKPPSDASMRPDRLCSTPRPKANPLHFSGS